MFKGERYYMKRFYIIFTLAFLGSFISSCSNDPNIFTKSAIKDPQLILSKDAKTEYVIIKPEIESTVDKYAINVLVESFHEKTTVTLPVFASDNIPANKKYIFVGISSEALNLLKENPIDNLQDQEFVIRSMEDSIFLYGKGLHGNLYAVLDFVEQTLGRKWFSRYDKPEFTVEQDLEILPLNRVSGFSFTYRKQPIESEFSYQQGMNMGFTETKPKALEGRKQKKEFPDGVVSLAIDPGSAHTSFDYIPHSVQKRRRIYDWITNDNYFKTNPEFFSMDKSQKRKPQQLCFSNPGLRKELTKNIMEHARLLSGDKIPVHSYKTKVAYITKEKGQKVIITLDSEDSSSGICFCPECKKLKDKYTCEGGAIFDYLFDLCREMKKKYPDVMIKTLAYRLSQTQKPPVLPKGEVFPDNLIVWFANVEDALNVSWNSPRNNSTYKDLLAWRKLTPNIWSWYYPSPFGLYGTTVPFCNIQRFTEDFRLLKEAGVSGVMYELGTINDVCGESLSDLFMYLYCKLSRDVNANVKEIIKEFTDNQYGFAAPLVRKYIDELEASMLKQSGYVSLIPRGFDFKDSFSYLTIDNIYRWQKYFDKMKTLVGPRNVYHQRISRLRKPLDFTTFSRWNDLSKKYPGYFSDYKVVKSRISDTRIPSRKAFIDDCEILIKTADVKVKPLPERFNDVDPSLVHRYLPVNKGRSVKKIMLDPDSAYGYAATIDIPELPLNFGFYQNDTKVRFPNRKITKDEIVLDHYKVYELGEIKVTPDCRIWFSSKSWATNLELGNRLYAPPAPNNDNTYIAYVSLKFDGPTYGGKGTEDVILCDQIIIVKKDMP